MSNNFFNIFFWGGEGEVELSNFDFRRRTTPKKNEKRKTKKKILKKIFDKSFFNSDFSHTKTIFSQKNELSNNSFNIFFFVFRFSFFLGGTGLLTNPKKIEKNKKLKTKKKY